MTAPTMIQSPITGIELDAGNYLRALPVGTTMSVGTVPFKKLRQVTHDPELLQPSPAAVKQRGGDDTLEAEATLHEMVQRALTGNKKANVPAYRAYIERTVTGGVGVLPPIHLWTPTPLEHVRTGDGTTYVLVPDGEYFISLDGETQLTSHYRLQRDPAVPPEVKKQHVDYGLAVVIHHGIPTPHARQYFHDLNVLAVKPNTSLGLSMDSSDPLMRIVQNLAETVPFLAGRVDRTSRQLLKNSPKVITLQALRQMVVNVAKGISGIGYGAKPVPLDDVDLDALAAVCHSWLDGYFTAFAAEVGDRENSLAGTGTVLAAVGALGHTLLPLDPAVRSAQQAHLLQTLREVDWRKDEHWTGIAGSINPRGVFTVRGTKESAYAVYAALADSHSSAYKRLHPDAAA